MKLTILGSGSPEAYVRRASSGYLIETGNDKILFDCGGGVFDNLLRAGLKPSDITHLVFSHLHSDHMMDYARLVHAAWDEGGAPIKVHGPAPIAELTEAYFGPNGVMSYDLRARTELKPSQDVWVARGGTLPRPWPAPQVTEITPGDRVECDTWHIETCKAVHAEPWLTCMAFALHAEGKSFVYSGDTGLTPDLDSLYQHADFLLHWCYRLDGQVVNAQMAAVTPTPSEIAAMAERCGVGQLLLTHFRINMDTDARNNETKNILAQHFSGVSGVAEDLDQFTI